MADYLRGSRFPLPDDWSPEGFICVRVTIPDDPQYLAILTGLLDELRKSKNFARDATGTGAATVSRTFDRALNQRYLETEICDMAAMRINPETCNLEALCGEEWIPVQTAGARENYDPNRDDPVDVPFDVPDPDPETGTACVSAARAAEGLRRVMERLDTAYALGTVVFWLEVFLTLFLLQVVRRVADIISQMSNAVTSYTQEEYHADFLAFDWEELKELLHCYYDANGVMSAGNHAALVDELGELVGANAIWAMLYVIINGMGSVGMTNAVNGDGYGIDEAECEACGDVFTHTDDMTTGMHGWSFVPFPASDPYDPSGTLGTWEALGARTTISANPGAGGYRLLMGQSIAPTAISSVRVTSGFATGNNTTEVWRVFEGVRTQINGSVQRDPMDAVDCGLYGTGAIVVFDCGNLVFDELEIYISSASSESWICEIQIAGQGSDPFGA